MLPDCFLLPDEMTVLVELENPLDMYWVEVANCATRRE